MTVSATGTRMIRKGYVDASTGQVHYREAGSGPPLILLHQNPSSSAMWEAVLPPLAERGIRAIALDMPGFGNSDAPAEEPGCPGYGRAVLEAVSNLGIEQFNLLGHHTGAFISVWMATHAPERVKNLVLWGIAVFEQEYRDFLVVEEPPTFSPDGSEMAAWWKNRYQMGTEKYDPEVVIRSAIEMLQTGYRRVWGHHAAGAIDLGALLPQVTQPALVICGERDRMWSYCEPAGKLIPNSRFHAFHGASMDIADERPEELAAVVADFVL